MNEFLSNLLIAVITAAIPVLTAYGVKLIRKLAANAEASASSTEGRDIIDAVASAVTDAVAATSQTYVDSLKSAGKFTKEAQRETAQKALAACLASLTPAVKDALEAVYGDINAYLTTKIEAEVRSQKRLTIIG